MKRRLDRYYPLTRLALLAIVATMLVACRSIPAQLAADATVAPAPLPTFTATPDVAQTGNTSITTTAPVSATAVAQVDATSLLPTVTPTSTPVRFDPDAVQLTLDPVFEGLDRPVFVTHAGDNSGRRFIVEKGGTIRIVVDGALLPDPLLDITDRVNSGGNEQGLLGLAFAPNYGESGYLYVNYSGVSGETIVERYQASSADPNQVDSISAALVITVAQPARNHNGGMLAFGPDGQLWIGLGDGGGTMDTFGNGQNPQSLLGKMLRLDVTSDPSQPYLVPPDNPWVEAEWNGAEVRAEIWAVGLRNPWRYSFDRQTGDLWIADVGQNQIEEINFVPAGHPGGLNFGWPLTEGSRCLGAGACVTEGLTLPVAEYDHSGHCSVSGGYVYRGAQFPALQGVYLYGDYCSGVIRGAWPNGQGGWATAQLLESGATISSFGEDEAGEIYLTDLGGGTVSQVTLTTR